MDIAEILYGPVEMTAELMQRIQLRRVVVRPADHPFDLRSKGCHPSVPSNPPEFYCNYCKYEW
jgi:hypothetical protein